MSDQERRTGQVRPGANTRKPRPPKKTQNTAVKAEKVSRPAPKKVQKARSGASAQNATEKGGKRFTKHHRESLHLDESIARPTRMKLFVRSAIPDFLLVLTVSVALVFTISYAFNSAAGYRGNVGLLIIITAPLLIAMFAGSWSKKALVVSTVATVAIAAVIIGVFISLSPGDTPIFTDVGINDVDENYAIFAMVGVVVPLLVFLLSRRPVGMVVLFAGGMFACGFVQFLYRDFMTEQPGIAASMIALVAILALFVYQVYKQSVYSAARLKRTSFFGVSVFSALMAVFCVLIGLGVFYGVVSTLDLSTPDIRPFERYAARPIDQNTGTYSLSNNEGQENTTDQTNDQERDTSQESTGEDESQEGDASSALDTPIGQLLQQVTGFSQSSDSQDRQQITYLILELTVIITVVIVILLIITAILLQRYRRTWRLKRIANKSLADQTTYLYYFFIERLRRLGIRKPAQLTPLVFAAGFDEVLAPFSRGTNGVTFMEITGLYMDAHWGAMDVQPEDFERVLTFYRQFFRNAREYVGWPRWLLYKFWRI